MLTRRAFVVGAVIASTPALKSCGQTLLPILGERGFNLIIDIAEKAFVGMYFSPGALLRDRPHQPRMDFSDYVADVLISNFQRKGAGRTYCSPVMLCTMGAGRHLQIGTDRPHAWSLVSGGASGNEAFKVHGRWLHWLFQNDKCDRTVNGDTRFEACGNDQCQLGLSKQNFLRGKDRE